MSQQYLDSFIKSQTGSETSWQKFKHCSLIFTHNLIKLAFRQNFWYNFTDFCTIFRFGTISQTPSLPFWAPILLQVNIIIVLCALSSPMYERITHQKSHDKSVKEWKFVQPSALTWHSPFLLTQLLNIPLSPRSISHRVWARYRTLLFWLQTEKYQKWKVLLLQLAIMVGINTGW